MHILEHENYGACLGQALKEQPPRTKEILAAVRSTLLEPEEMRQTGLYTAPLVWIGKVLLKSSR